MHRERPHSFGGKLRLLVRETMIHDRNGKKRTTMKWAVLGAILCLIALAAVAVVYAHDTRGSPEETQPVITVTETPAACSTVQHPEQHSGRIDPATIIVPEPVTVPSTGIFVVVRYPGAFTGNWQADNTSHDVHSSGDRLYAIENTGQTVSAEFRKADRSARQNLTVEIWKDGKILASGITKDLFGEVQVSGRV